MRAYLKGRYIVFEPMPQRSETPGIKLVFNPTKHWEKTHTGQLPISHAWIIAGQCKCKLPNYLRVKCIQNISYLYGGQWYAVAL